jgi:hypothetical protein
MHPTTTAPKRYVVKCVSWLLPANVSLSAMPKPLIAMTDTEPTSEQMDRYTMGLVWP